MTYENEISEIIKNNLLSRDEIFDYRDTPLEIYCNKLFLYYKALIRNNSDIYDIEPNFFVFKNKTTVNASAVVKEGCSLVSINIGTIKELKEIFLDNAKQTKDIFGESIQELDQFLVDKKSSVMDFMYNSASIFLLNHEIGHLIQNIDKIELNLNESNEEISDFNIDRHIYEVDSDIFSAMKLSQDIYRIWDDFDDTFKTDLLLCNLISLATSAIGVFKLFNLNAEKGIYYKEKSHPHVSIRVTIIQEIMVDFISHLSGSTISEEYKNITISNSLSIIEKLNIYKGDSFFNDFVALTLENSDNIEEYSKFLILEVSTNKNCSYYKMRNYR